jgi:hypothetical protein
VGTFVTQEETPVLFTDKAAGPGVSSPPGWSNSNKLLATEANALRDAALDLRTAHRALLADGSALPFTATGSTTARTAAARFADVANVLDFGAVGDGSTDDRAAFLLAAATGKPLYVPAGYTFSLSGSVTVTSHVLGRGTLKGANLLVVGADNVLVEGVTLQGTNLGGGAGSGADTAINAADVDGLTVRGVRVENARVRVRNTQLATMRGFRLLDSHLVCDFSTFDYVATQNDILTVRGVDGVWIVGNTFDATNVHRVGKISDTEGHSDANSVSAFHSRNVFIADNHIVGTTTSAKQVFDLFSGTSDAIFSGNTVEAEGWTSIIESKTGITTADAQNLRVMGNRFACDGTAISLQGSYGATTPGHASGHQNAVIQGNTLERTGTGTEPLVTARFFHSFNLLGNTFLTPATMDAHDVVEVLPCEASAVSGNSITHGRIQYGNSTSNHAGDPFSATVLSLSCVGNRIMDFGGVTSGGIWVNTLPAASCEALIANNFVRQTVDDATAAGAVAVTSSTLSRLVCTGNISKMALATEERLRLSSATISQVVEEGNSWNLRSASATYDPGSIAAGAAVVTTVSVSGAVAGDFCEAAFSTTQQGIALTAWVSTTGTVSVEFKNTSGGAIDLASGTLRVRAKRFA